MTALEFYKKTASFGQAFCRVGLPFILVYRGTDYLIFAMRAGHARQHMPWYVFIPIDAAAAMIVSAMWAGVMRSVVGKREFAGESEKDV
jgi:hypothetical protein